MLEILRAPLEDYVGGAHVRYIIQTAHDPPVLIADVHGDSPGEAVLRARIMVQALEAPAGEGGTGAADGRRKVLATWLDEDGSRIAMRDDGVCFVWQSTLPAWGIGSALRGPNLPIPQD